MEKKPICLIGIIFILIGIISFTFNIAACSAQESIYTTLSDSLDEAQVIIRGSTDTDSYKSPVIDPTTHSLINIDYIHNKIHEGKSFKSDLNSDDIKLEGDNNALHISFITDDSPLWVHLTLSAWATGAADLILLENPTGGVIDGSILLPINRNRNDINLSCIRSTHVSQQCAMTQDATAPTGGLILHHWKLGVGKTQIGGVDEADEFVLKQNTLYSIRMASDIGDVRGQLTLNWYEHSNRSP